MRRAQDRQTVTIAINQSLSAAVDFTERTLVGIIMPAAWTAADITFAAAATDGGTYVPVYDAAGTELAVTTSTSRFVALSPDAVRGLRFFKLRSGTVGSAVTQAAARDLILVTEYLED